MIEVAGGARLTQHFLCGLHGLYSHIMASSDLFTYLFVHESRAPVTWSSAVAILLVNVASSSFFR